MKYILMAAGCSKRLHPLTLTTPKSLYRLDERTTLIGRMVASLARHDAQADIVVITGHGHELVEQELADAGVTFVRNPFYSVTNSIASLWFAREHLGTGDVVLMNGDLVLPDALVRDAVCAPVARPELLVDSSIREGGDCNVQVLGEEVLLISNKLEEYAGEYVGVVRLNAESGRIMRAKVEQMVNDGRFDQWFENALVQLVFDTGFKLYFHDVAGTDWTEVDSVDDMLLARQIHAREIASAGAADAPGAADAAGTLDASPASDTPGDAAPENGARS